MTTIDSGANTYAGFDDLTISLDAGVLTVTLNRPESLNSLTAPMLSTFAETLERAAGGPRVRVVRIGGAGRVSPPARESARKTTPTPVPPEHRPTCWTRPIAASARS